MALSKASLDGGYRSYAVVFGLNVLGAHPEVVVEKERRVVRRSCGLERLSKSCHFRVLLFLKVPSFCVIGGFEEGRLRDKLMRLTLLLFIVCQVAHSFVSLDAHGAVVKCFEWHANGTVGPSGAELVSPSSARYLSNTLQCV